MVLSVPERLLLLGLLPVEGDITTILIVRKLRESLSFSEEEHQILKIRFGGQPYPGQDDLPKDQQVLVPSGQIGWDGTMDPHKDFQFGERALAVVQDSLKSMLKTGDANKTLTESQLLLYERFVGPIEVPLPS